MGASHIKQRRFETIDDNIINKLSVDKDLCPRYHKLENSIRFLDS